MTTIWGVCGSCSLDWMTNASADERDVGCRRLISSHPTTAPSRMTVRRPAARLTISIASTCSRVLVVGGRNALRVRFKKCFTR